MASHHARASKVDIIHLADRMALIFRGQGLPFKILEWDQGVHGLSNMGISIKLFTY